ncbi:hypothetical protein LTR55_012174, partial [Exophiala xenobiotica]
LYDECHITLCKALAAVRGGRSHNERFRQRPSVELGPLCHRLTSQPDAMSDQIVLQATSNENVPMEAVWKPVVPMAFDHLPKLQSLSGLLPGEQASSQLGHPEVSSPEVYNHDGPALSADGRPVTGTFRVASNTYTEGGDLEAVLVRHHEMIYLVLDQAESKSDIPKTDRVTLEEQFGVVLAQPGPLVQTVLTIDTGGDVFVANRTCGSTPEQDLRVQEA